MSVRKTITNSEGLTRGEKSRRTRVVSIKGKKKKNDWEPEQDGNPSWEYAGIKPVIHIQLLKGKCECI